MLQLVEAHTEPMLTEARALLAAYAAGLGIDLGFQHFEEESGALPGSYVPPDGSLLVATWNRRVAGCVAVRSLEAGVAEMKRLYVRPAFRRYGIGRALAEAAVDAARRSGYRRMRLDTLATMREAQDLYASMGFRPIPPYCHNPIPGTIFMELLLKQNGPATDGQEGGTMNVNYLQR